MEASRIAAFYRVEGTLVRRPTLAAAAWLAASSQRITSRLTRLGAVAAAAPFALGPLRDPTLSTRLGWASLREVSEDRLVLLGREYFETHLADHLLAVGVDLVRRSKAQGHRVVLISDSLDVIVGPLAEQLEADDLVCNRMELRNGRATGRLADPVVGGHLSGQWLRDYAARHHLDLTLSCAYGHAEADSTLLSAIGRPCTVDPDRGLRRIARDLDWPVVVS